MGITAVGRSRTWVNLGPEAAPWLKMIFLEDEHVSTCYRLEQENSLLCHGKCVRRDIAVTAYKTLHFDRGFKRCGATAVLLRPYQT
jgi:hypothetical protein